MDIVAQIETALDATPTLVLSLWSHAYAEADGNTAGVRAGVRGEEDWDVELEGCSVADAQYLEQKYGVDRTHYMVDDETCGQIDYAQAVLRYQEETVARNAPKPTIALAELVEMIITKTLTDGEAHVVFEGATWYAQR